MAEIIATCRGSFLKQYKRRFPFHLISHFHIRRFWNKLDGTELLPTKEQYIKLNAENEFFDITLSLVFENIKNPMVLQLPYPINIHKVTEYIRKNNIPPALLNVSILKELINPECLCEFDRDMKVKIEGKELSADIKKNNPVILLYPQGIVEQGYLINGTHRTIQAIKDGLNTVEGYIVYPEVCSSCGMSENFEMLYNMMKRMYLKVHGISRNEDCI